jgi:hypothetical protein
VRAEKRLLLAVKQPTPVVHKRDIHDKPLACYELEGFMGRSALVFCP